MRVDVVGKGENRLGVAAGPLEGNGDLALVVALLEVGDLAVDRFTVGVEVLDEVDDAPRVLERLGNHFFGTLIAEADLEALREERHFSQPADHGLCGVLRGLLKDVRVCPERHLGAGPLHLLDLPELRGGDAVLEVLSPQIAVAHHLDMGTNGEGVHDGNAHTVKTSGHLIGLGVELSPGVQGGHHRGDGSFPGLLVLGDRDTSAVVAHTYPAIGKQRDIDAGAVASHRFVNRVVHDLPDEVMESLGTS